MSTPTPEQWTDLVRTVARIEGKTDSGRQSVQRIEAEMVSKHRDHETRLRRVETRTTVIWTALGLAWAGLLALGGWIKIGVLK